MCGFMGKQTPSYFQFGRAAKANQPASIVTTAFNGMDAHVTSSKPMFTFPICALKSPITTSKSRDVRFNLKRVIKCVLALVLVPCSLGA